MLVAVTGAKGTGKSTLIGDVDVLCRSHGMNINFPPSPGAKASESNIQLGESGSDRTHLYFANEHLRTISDSIEGVTLADRCLVDHLSYVRCLSEDRLIVDLMSNLTALGAPKYRKIFVTQIHELLPQTEFPSESLEFRESIDQMIWSIITEFNLDALLLPKRRDEAAMEVFSVIRGLHKD